MKCSCNFLPGASLRKGNRRWLPFYFVLYKVFSVTGLVLTWLTLRTTEGERFPPVEKA
jgi:hypothetical protein